jgi:hypothetical protein
MQNKKILVIIPAYNEAGRVASLVLELRQRHPAFDILIIDDCSQDATYEEARLTGAKVISLPFNLGIGGAVQTGIKYAGDHDYDAAVQVDGDGQHDPLYIADIIAPVLSGRLDMCVGSRFLSDSGFRSSFLRRIGIRFFCWLIGVLTGRELTDPTSGFRAYGRRAIEIFSHYYPIDFPEPEGLVVAERYGASIGEVPVVMRERKGGASSIRHLLTAYYMIKVTLAIILWTVRRTSPLGAVRRTSPPGTFRSRSLSVGSAGDRKG